MPVLLLEPALMRVREIVEYSTDRWGAEQAERYVIGLYRAIEGLADGSTTSRPVPAALGVSGYFFRYERHFVYWRRLANGAPGVVSILHERMQQRSRLREDFGL